MQRGRCPEAQNDPLPLASRAWLRYKGNWGKRVPGILCDVPRGKLMSVPVEDQVIDFYHDLFGDIFWNAFQAEISERLRRNAVRRAVEESADAASQSLTRFFVNQRLTKGEAGDVLNALARLGAWIELDLVTNPNVAPEVLADAFDGDNPCPDEMKQVGAQPLYRVALEGVVQVLMLLGPVMAEWRRIGFSGEFELLDRVIDRLNEISASMGAMAGSAQDAEGERFELTYRDYLLQRFFRIEAGTVRMTTNVNVDLRELFVMPRVLPRPVLKRGEGVESAALVELMDLAQAREVFRATGEQEEKTEDQRRAGITALEQVLGNRRTVIVGTPGSGKSTFLEWLQLRIANADEEMILGDQQAIPVLLRVRQLDPKSLPRGVALIEKAMASKDRAGLMPEGWIDRQMEAGRVLLMVDGLDETEPDLRDRYVLPWLEDLSTQYPHCAYVVSSRPAGYPPGTLGKLDFVECDLCNFGRPQVEEYCRHWCTAVRLAQNEPEEEARREGEADGARIVAGFKEHPYILDLARNPLMLSAICLVNYFESGQLPEDRAKLYGLCVEGLLHHWDQRRGIHSKFTLDEKLRVCREVAIAMQAENLAEYDESRVREIFAEVLGDSERADALLEHVRYRTGLLIERRADVYAFAHLTFQEYLAGLAVREGNRLEIHPQRLADEHTDTRWKEVIPLYCGVAASSAVRDLLNRLIQQQNTWELALVLCDCFSSSGKDVREDKGLRQIVLRRILVAPGHLDWYHFGRIRLSHFPEREVAAIANEHVARSEGQHVPVAYFCL
ncbi:MAG: NACHT domain-containing protein, partial [Planctomycetota bacterium]